MPSDLKIPGNHEAASDHRVRSGAVILVVEDNPDTLNTLVILLERRGFITISAIDVASGILEGTRNTFDLLLSDIGLPDGSGCDIIKTLRKSKRFPAIALTAYCTLEDIESCRNAGFDIHVAKPYEFPDLERKIRTLLNPEVMSV